MSAGPYRVGVDIGGTFTDVVLMDEDNTLTLRKVPTTPGRFNDGLMEGVRRLDRDPAEMVMFSHGTTVATNAVVERKGARTALITTEGFRDTLLFRRTDRVQFDLWWQPPETLIPRRMIFEVPERLDYTGEPLVPLDEDAARAVAARLRRLGVEAVAIVFLHSFTNPEHEVRMRDILREELPEAFISWSSAILPEVLEYERTVTTLANAYVGPVMEQYFGKLSSDLSEFGYDGDILISSSSGGMMTPTIASTVPAKTMASGPAAGVIAAARLAQTAGFRSIITFDMGGTSLDLGLVDEGAIRRTNEWQVAFSTPIRFPAVDVQSIGAGGGSIAWIDGGGSLRSGPQSAAADPGPACYGRGGDQPTNTDAQVVLGRLDPERFLGGQMPVDGDLAREAVDRVIAVPLGLETVEEAAEAILRISNNNMVQATRLTSVSRGYDPRDFALFAYGGGGPLFAAAIAREGDIPTVIVPPHPGLVCALGLHMMDIKHELTQSVLRPVTELDSTTIHDLCRTLQTEVSDALVREGVGLSDISISAEAEMRYFGMSQGITVPLPDDTDDLLAALVDAFEATHQQEYGYTVSPDVAVAELATIRIAGTGAVERDDPEPPQLDDQLLESALRTRRPVYFDGQWHDTAVYERDGLRPGHELVGPGIVEQIDTTTVIPPGMTAVVDQHHNIIISVGTEQS